MVPTRERKVLVAGATGRVGSAVACALAARGVPCTALIRSEERRVALPDPQMPAVVADLADEERMSAILEGVERMLLCSAHGPGMRDHQLCATRAAARAGVARVVKISASPASAFPGTTAAAAAAHLAVEDALRTSGVETVIVRPNAFAQVLLGLRADIHAGVIRLPLADARVSWVDADDVGRVAARLLFSEDGADSDIVEVTGPEALTMDQACAAIANAIGRDVTYQPVSDEQARHALTARGVDPWYADHVIGVFSLFRAHDAGATTDAVERITGHPATPLIDVARRLLSPDPTQV